MKLWLSLLCATVLVYDCVYEAQSCFVEEKRSLLDVKQYAFVYEEPYNLSWWVDDPKSDCCKWERVTCDSSSGHVIHLSLEHLIRKFAVLNASVFTPFKHLTSLNLSHNEINIWNPKEFNILGRLPTLTTLDLSATFLGKDIFKSLGALRALRYLFLDNNRIGGSLDDRALANLTNLEVLNMANCNISGPMPTQSLCQMKNLQELDFSGNSFGGTLHACFWNLTSLRALDLSGNVIGGTIPSSSIARLSSLEYISLSENMFEGLLSLTSFANNSKLKVLALGGLFTNKLKVETESTSWIPSFQLEVLEIINCQVNNRARTFPTFLQHQHGLKYVDLSYNNLVGVFPSWLLVNNRNLVAVLLNHNSFTGEFYLPVDAVEHMDQLHRLKISNNRIQGLLPKNIGFFLPNLSYLDASNNMFHGEIPASIGDMSELVLLDLANNNFSGEIPKHMLLGCASLKMLTLSNNSLWGQVFPGPLKWKELSILVLDNNQFNGTLGEGLLSMPFLTLLELSSNKLSGKLPGWIGNNILSYLGVAHNNFEGALPEELCHFVYLGAINLSYNRFSGALPSCLSKLDLDFIYLQGNSFTGTIPDKLLGGTLFGMTIDLRDNKLSGSIPMDMNRPKLNFLLLAGNQLTGLLPNELCNLEELIFLDLSRNDFTGSIPTCLNNMSFRKTDLDYGFNVSASFDSHDDRFIIYQHMTFQRVWYEDDSYLTDIQEEVQLQTKSLALLYKGDILNYMFGIDLSSNQLTGEIPWQIGDLLSLRTLNLSHNHLNGSIPENFHKLQELESLDLSYNKLSGKFPLQLKDLNALEIFNVSYNNLSGKVPNKGQFGTFDETSYKGNPYLSWENSNRGNITPSPLTPSKVKEEDDSAIDFTFFYWSFAMSYVMVLLTFVTILWINPLWRRMWFYFIETCLYKCFYQFH